VVKPCASTFQAVKDNAPAFSGGPTGAIAPEGHDVWVVGNDAEPNEPAARHWDGTSWTKVSLPNTGTGDRLQGVSGAAPDDLWAVGSSNTNQILPRSTLVEHYDGTAWTMFPAAPATMAFNELEGVAAVTPDDVWAVGDQGDGNFKRGGLAEHFNGKAWRTLPTPQDGGLLAGVSAVAGDIWAVGQVAIPNGQEAPRIEHSTGGPFTTVASPVPVGTLLAVTQTSPTDVWAVGEKGKSGPNNYELIEHYDGTSWTVATTPQILGTTLTAVSAVTPTDVWAAGTTQGATTNSVAILHWDGTAWTSVAPAVYPDAEFSAAWAITHSRSRVWVIGENQNQRNVTPGETDTSQEHCA